MTRKKGTFYPVLNSNPDMLEGLNAISEFIGKSPNTTASYIKRHGLPATKLPNGRWLTHKHLILQWITASHRGMLAEKTWQDEVGTASTAELAEQMDKELQSTAAARFERALHQFGLADK
jgi:hypothetical protein